MKEKVAVFIPCYNAEKYIGQMLDSILNQTYKDFKVIIVDDGSTDNSKEIIYQYAEKDKRIALHRNQENKGIAFVRNQGLTLCDCEYIALMDADDIAPPYRLETEVAYLEQHPDVDGVGGLYQLIDENGCFLSTNLRPVLSDSAIRASMIFYNPIANGSMMFRRKMILENKLTYCSSLRFLEDYFFWTEFLKYGRLCNLNQVMQYYRISSGSIERQTHANNLTERNACFDSIHEKVYDLNCLKLTDKEKKILKKATHDKSDLSGFFERISFFRLLRHLQKDTDTRNEEWRQALRTVCKEYTVQECKNMIKGFINR